MRQKGNGVRTSRLWAQMLGCENTVIEGVDWDQRDDAGGGQLSITVHVRPVRRLAGRCRACGKKRPGYDQGDGRRRWRALDLGTVRAELEAAAPRVACPEHGVVVAAVPWARHGAAHTRYFDDQVAWLAVACSKTAITSLMRISWRTVGHIIARVSAENQAGATTPVRHLSRTIRISSGDAKSLARARYALWKNPENLTGRQQAKLAWIEKTHPYLWRAYLLKEGLRLPFQLKGEEGKHALTRWLSWAARCRIPEFTELAKKIRRHLPSIHATLDHGLSNGLIESVNTKIRVLTRISYGFHKATALIALAMLALSGLRPPLPGR